MSINKYMNYSVNSISDINNDIIRDRFKTWENCMVPLHYTGGPLRPACIYGKMFVVA